MREPVEQAAELLWRVGTPDGKAGAPWPPDQVAASSFRADAAALRDANLLSPGGVDEGGREEKCERLLVGQGTDTWDPLCQLPKGHQGACSGLGNAGAAPEGSDVDDATAEAFMDGARQARENALEIAREGATPALLERAGFAVVDARLGPQFDALCEVLAFVIARDVAYPHETETALRQWLGDDAADTFDRVTRGWRWAEFESEPPAGSGAEPEEGTDDG